MSIKSNAALTTGLGADGFEYTTAAGAAGPWVAVQCIGATAFSTFTSKNQTGAITGITFPDQCIIRGPITAFTVSSGAVIAYKGLINAD